MSITSLAHSFHVDFSEASASFSQAFWVEPSIVALGDEASGQGAASWSPHG